MEAKRICPECRRPLADDAPEGLCPQCLVKAGLGSDANIGGETESGQPHFVAPQPEELTGRFPQLEIISFIGQGGMGAVYKARQKQLDRIVALKILPPGIGEAPQFAQRFAREAKALAKLDHPGIVTIHDFGQADGLFFFVMEFVDGVNLRQLLQSGRISSREALAIVPQICDALQYAHDQGIVHRDIKPENILLDRRGRVKVADFGLAKLVGGGNELASESAGAAGPSALTEVGKILGTPNYIAPEQMEHPGEVDHRADIYALGVVLYQMLTGELPGKLIVPPSSKVQVDVRLDEVVLRALEQKPERRYQQASAFKTEVETIARTSQIARPRDQKEINEAQWRNPANWSFGFYFSKRDSRKWWVPRRIPGTGWTINLGRWQGAATLVTILCSLIAVIAFGIRSGHANRSTLEQHAVSRNPIPVSAIQAQTGDVGMYVSCLGTVSSSNTVDFSLAESYVQQVIQEFQAGKTLPVEAFDRQGAKFSGSLAGVDNEMDVATGTLKCKAAIRVIEGNGQMVPGLLLDTRLQVGVKQGVLRVPSEAVLRENGSAFVWVIKPDQTVARHLVQLGITNDKKPAANDIISKMLERRNLEYLPRVSGLWTEVRSGLSTGELVVFEPPNVDLHEDQKVTYKLVSPADSPEEHGPSSPVQGKPIARWATERPLSEWIADLQSPQPKIRKLAESAIAELGTNSLPEFLGILGDRDTSVEADDLRYNTAAALKFVGPDTESAIPSFVSLLVSGNQQSAYAGARALAFTAGSVSKAFVELTNGLVSLSPGVRDAATHGVSLLPGSGSTELAEEALPTLLMNLYDSAQSVRADTAAALGLFVQHQRINGLDEKADVIVPAVTGLLQDHYSYARENAAMVLRAYGKDAAPVVVGLLTNQDDQMRECATNALSIIGNQLSNGASVSTDQTQTSRGSAFSVETTGSGPLSYHWNFAPSNPTDQSRATASSGSNSLLQFRLVAGSEEKGTIESLPDLRGRKVALEAATLLDQSAVALARIERNQSPALYPWHIDLEFTPEGTRRFAEITRTNINRRLAVIYRGRVLMSPVIRDEINGGHCSIDGDFSQSELADIAWHLNHAAGGVGATPQEVPFTAKLFSPYYGSNPRNLATNQDLIRPDDMLDLDHRRVLHFPPEWTDWSERRQCRWLKESNVNLYVDVRPEGLIKIIAFDTRLSRAEKGALPSQSRRSQVLELLATSSLGLDHQTNVFGIERAVYSVAPTNTLPVEFAFRTAEGTVGVFNITIVDTNLPPGVALRVYPLDPASDDTSGAQADSAR